MNGIEQTAERRYNELSAHLGVCRKSTKRRHKEKKTALDRISLGQSDVTHRMNQRQGGGEGRRTMPLASWPLPESPPRFATVEREIHGEIMDRTFTRIVLQKESL